MCSLQWRICLELSVSTALQLTFLICCWCFSQQVEAAMKLDSLPSKCSNLDPPPLNSTAAAGPKRFALCFFGLTRSLNWTVESIENHILGPLNRAGTPGNEVKYDVFLHTYAMKSVNNPRTNERSVPYTHLNDTLLLNITR
jgi:hypothetical protein